MTNGCRVGNAFLPTAFLKVHIPQEKGRMDNSTLPLGWEKVGSNWSENHGLFKNTK